MNILDTAIRNDIRTRQAKTLRQIARLDMLESDHDKTDAAIMSILSGATHSDNARHYNVELKGSLI